MQKCGFERLQTALSRKMTGLQEKSKLSRQTGRTPHGVRGLKCERDVIKEEKMAGRTPHGVRGLKSKNNKGDWKIWRVAPLMGCVD